MGWCSIAQVRERNPHFDTERGWSAPKIQTLIERCTRRMKVELQQSFGIHFADWDANYTVLLPQVLNDLCIELASVQGTLDIYRREGQPAPTEDWIAYNDIKQQLKQIAQNLVLTDPTGATIDGSTSSCDAADVTEIETDVDELLRVV